MKPILFEYEHDITCIDTMYLHAGHAACYLLIQDGHAAFIDTGTGHTVPYLLETLNQKNLSVEDVDFVIPTHVHLDHAGGAGLLMSELPNAKLVIHPRGAPHMINPEKLIAGATAVYGDEQFQHLFGKVVPIDQQRVIKADDEFEITLANRKLKFLDTPGHARHHFCIYDEISRGVFTGDTFGLSYREMQKDKVDFILPTTTPVQFEPEPWYASLDKILSHQPENIYLTHFGRVTDIDKLAQQLRQDIAKYAELAKQYLGKENSEKNIHNDLNEYLNQRLQPNYSDEEIQHFTEFLQPDLKLNAAGLKVWLSRLEKAA